MKKTIQAKNDFTEENLPHNRWQLFGDLLKHRLGFLLKAGLLTALFFIPLFVWNIYMQEEFRLLIGSATEETAYETAVNLLALSNTKNAVNVLFCGVCGIGIGGGVYLVQKCAWGEIVFASEFFVGLKRDFGKNFFFGVVIGLSWWLAEYAVRFIPLSTLDGTAAILMYGVTTVQFALIAVMTCFSVCQNAIYSLSLFSLIKNSFMFAFKGFFPMLGVLLYAVCPMALLLVNNMIVDVIAAALFSVFLGTALLAVVLYSDSLFDRFINRENYPQLVDKNIYRVKKERESVRKK